MSYPFILTDHSVVVVVNNEIVTVQHTAPNFRALRDAIQAQDWEAVGKNLGVAKSLETWSRGHFRFEDGDRVTYKGQPFAPELADRMIRMATAGESPEPLMNFWEKLQKNPSMRSVEQLYPFLKHQGIPIQANGNFLAYKGVKPNYRDKHSGTVDNSPGTTHEMPRNQISDDPRVECHFGFHVGALSYARGFGEVVVVCEVDPADVVCIPYDSSQQKMRVCKYRVVGNHNGELLPSTTYVPEGGDAEGAESEVIELTEDMVVTDETGGDAGEAGEDEEQPEKVSTHTRRDGSKKKPKQASDEARVSLKVPAGYRKMHGMDRRELLEQSIGDLRAYASKVLHVVGASKIPGGKVPLVAQILKVRRNFS